MGAQILEESIPPDAGLGRLVAPEFPKDVGPAHLPQNGIWLGPNCFLSGLFVHPKLGHSLLLKIAVWSSDSILMSASPWSHFGARKSPVPAWKVWDQGTSLSASHRHELRLYGIVLTALLTFDGTPAQNAEI